VTQSLAARHRSSPAGPAGALSDRSYLEINLGRLEANLHALRRLLAGSNSGHAVQRPAMCAVVKKQAYGLGAVAIAHRLVKAGVDMLAVYDAAEAEELVTAGITAPMLVLMPVHELARTNALYRHAARGKLHLAVHGPEQLAALNEVGHRFGLKLPVHLYLDTGMSRGGLNREQLAKAIARACESRFVQIAGLYSHLATADSDGAFAESQRQRLEQALREHAPLIGGEVTRHLANTCGILRDASLHYDMVRPGLGLLGYGPEQMPIEDALEGEPLVPVARWMSRLIHVQQYPVGTAVGYGGTDVLERRSTLGVVPVGYGDGYPLELSNQAVMRLEDADGHWPHAPIRGRVSMDQLVVDLTDVAGSTDALDSLLNASVEVYSDEPTAPNALPRLAQQAGTHCYELLCRLSPRLKRYHVNE